MCVFDSWCSRFLRRVMLAAIGKREFSVERDKRGGESRGNPSQHLRT